LEAPLRPAYGGRLYLRILLSLVLILLVIAIYFFVRNRRLQKRLSEEVRELGGNQRYRRVVEEAQQ
jgi:uncharacterized membrane protein